MDEVEMTPEEIQKICEHVVYLEAANKALRARVAFLEMEIEKSKGGF